MTGATGGPFTVSGSHTYAALGPYTITVKIDDADGSNVTKSCPFTVFVFAPGRGAFVIGDRQLGHRNRRHLLGSAVGEPEPAHRRPDTGRLQGVRT